MNFIQITTDEEIEFLSRLANEIWNEYWTTILSQAQINYMLEKFQSKFAIKKQLVEEHYQYFLIKVADKIVGYFGVSTEYNLLSHSTADSSSPSECSYNYLFLSKLYLKKEFRNLGYGKLSFEKIKEIAKLNNKESIQLTVNKNNLNTIKTYEKWGFRTIEDTVTDIGNGFVMDDYIMECAII